MRADLVRRSLLIAVHGSHFTPGEVLLRLLVVKRLYTWSYAETVRRVADSLVLRWFSRVYIWRAPDATTLLRWAWTVRPTTLQALIARVALLAQQAQQTQQAKIAHARRLRVDATVVETPIHYPTYSGPLGDGVRVLTRLELRARPVLQKHMAGKPTVFRNWMRLMRRTLQALYRIVRRKAHTTVAQERPLYERLIQIAEQKCGKPRSSARRSTSSLRWQVLSAPAALAVLLLLPRIACGRGWTAVCRCWRRWSTRHAHGCWKRRRPRARKTGESL